MGPPVVLLEARSNVPKVWVEAFRRTNLIYGLELSPLLGFVFMNMALLANRTVNIYIDNNNALAALIRGDSNTVIVADMAAVFWRALVALGIDVRLGRVGSKLNIAGIPTRDKPRLPYQALRKEQFEELFTLLDIVRRARENVFRQGDFPPNKEFPIDIGRSDGLKELYPNPFFLKSAISALRAALLNNGQMS